MGSTGRAHVLTLPSVGHDAVGQILTAVNDVDRVLGDRLHTATGRRPYATRRCGDRLRVTSFDHALTAALLATDAETIERSVRPDDLDGDGGNDLVMRFVSPTVWRRGQRDYLIPDPDTVFSGVIAAWQDLADTGWPPLDDPFLNTNRIGGDIVESRRTPFTLQQRRPTLGFTGIVRYDLTALLPHQRALCWRLARFAELRNVGRHTAYGMGAIFV